MRVEDWPEKLAEYLGKPHKFDWVENNCALFAAGGVFVITGIDYTKEYRKLKTKLGLIKKLKKAGGLEAAWDAEYDQIPVNMAQRGDSVLVMAQINESEQMETMGICIGDKVALLTEQGMTFYPLKDAITAWRVI